MSRLTDEQYRHVISTLMRSCNITREEILRTLNETYGCDISLRTLDRIRQRLGLTRNEQYVPADVELSTAINVIQRQTNDMTGTVLALEGVRAEHPTWHVQRDRVAVLLREINPRAVAVRAETTVRERVYHSDGPNDIWHYDQNDKLKPYGIPLHAAIDGYSRFILWLKVVPSNNNPRVIVHHYLNAVATLNGCPRVTRSDHGSENNNAAAAQRMFRLLQLPDEQFWIAWNSHRWGKSTANTRIESVWSRLRSQGLPFWREPLQRLERDGFLRDDRAIRILQRMIVPLVQQWLDRLRIVWNRHRIRRSRPHVIPGPPIHLLASQRRIDRLQTVPPAHIAAARQVFCPDSDIYTLWMSDAERIVADEAIQHECAVHGLLPQHIDYDNWQPIFMNIIRKQIQDDVDCFAPITVPGDTAENAGALSDVTMAVLSEQSKAAASTNSLSSVSTVLNEPRWRPLRISQMNKSTSKVRKYLVEWGPNAETVFTKTWENEQWFLGHDNLLMVQPPAEDLYRCDALCREQDTSLHFCPSDIEEFRF